MKSVKCTDCNGTGQVGYAVDISDYCPCPHCGGAGELDVLPCGCIDWCRCDRYYDEGGRLYE